VADLDDDERLRGRLVDGLSAGGRIRNEAVAQAFRTVPRHLFLPAVNLANAYTDEAIATKWDQSGQTISSASQPAIMAIMLEQLAVGPGQRVLEIGAGTGYNAALLAFLVGETGAARDTGAVTTLDIDADLVDRARRHLRAAHVEGVSVVDADGADGWPESAPYDRIIVTAAASDLAPAWVAQLVMGGRLVLPLSLRGVQQSVALERRADHLASLSIVGCGFLPLRGALAGPDLLSSLEPGVLLRIDERRCLDLEALRAALSRPGEHLATGVSMTAAEAMDGLALWLALHEAGAGQLSVLGSVAGRLGLGPGLVSVAGMAHTTALVGEGGLAALVRGQPEHGPAFGVGVVSFGRPGADLAGLADRLVARVREWAARGRPSRDTLRIRAYPAASRPLGGAAVVLENPHTRLLLDW